MLITELKTNLYKINDIKCRIFSFIKIFIFLKLLVRNLCTKELNYRTNKISILKLCYVVISDYIENTELIIVKHQDTLFPILRFD